VDRIAVADECNHPRVVPFAAGKKEKGEFPTSYRDNTPVSTRKIAIVVILRRLKPIPKGIDSRMVHVQRYPRDSQAKSITQDGIFESLNVQPCSSVEWE
jgi:hypothetical protein